MKRIIGVGHSCLDKICSIENWPREDESTHITSISVQGGGAVATALVAASRLGCDTAFIGNIGFDSVSTEIEKLFASEGVSTQYLVRDHDVTGLESFVMVSPSGARTKFPQRDYNKNIVFTKELEDAIAASAVLHIDATNWENAYKAVLIAKANGVVVSLDGCSMQADNGKNRKLVSLVDILIMNRKYPLRVAEAENHHEALEKMANCGPKIIMCTLGSEGVLASIDGKIEAFPAYPVDVVDTTGAGDVFHGAFLTAYLEGYDVREAIRFASVTAGLKCRKSGGRAGIPTKSEVLAALKK